MRPLSEWDEGDLQRLIDDDVQESLTLDYKRSDALSKSDDKKKLELSKDVSAFANSAGGRLIYGIVEDGPHPKELDKGSDPKVITREWLEQVINTTIQPRIHGAVIKPVPLASGGTAFVVDIPKTEAGGPHQAGDQRYYRRFNFQSVPMYHHEIMDVANRAASPLIEMRWDHVRRGTVANGEKWSAFDLSLHNRSAQPALYGACTVYMDDDAEADKTGLNGQWTGIGKTRIRMPGPGGEHAFRIFQRTFAVPADQPLYRELPLVLGRMNGKSNPNTQYFIGWEFTCPGFSRIQWGSYMANQNGEVKIHWYKEDEG